MLRETASLQVLPDGGSTIPAGAQKSPGKALSPFNEGLPC